MDNAVRTPLWIAVIAVVVALVASVTSFTLSRQAQDLSKRVNHSLCSLRTNIQQTQVQAKKSLVSNKQLHKDNPKLLGLSDAVWQKSFKDAQTLIDNRQRTLNSLSSLDC